MTANGTATLLALLATDRALTPADSADGAPSACGAIPSSSRTSRTASPAAPRGCPASGLRQERHVGADLRRRRHRAGRRRTPVRPRPSSPTPPRPIAATFIADLTEQAARHLFTPQ